MSKLRFALLGLAHESNTFAPGTTGWAQFDSVGILRGPQIREVHGGGQSTVSGFLAACDELGVDCAPLIFTFPIPSGVIEDAAFEGFLSEMLRLLETGGPWDGVLLAQHGAAVAESEPDLDGAVIEAVRRAVGPQVPIAVALDLHANVSQRMVDHSTVTVIYSTNPHIDARERAFEAASIAIRAARGECRPVQALQRVPVVPEIGRQNTNESPMRELYLGVGSAASTILSASMAMGYPYADVPDLGMACIAITDGDVEQARSTAAQLARAAWEQRGSMTGGVVSIAEAVSSVTSSEQGPVLLLDTGDNIGGGTAGDSTVLLHELRRAGVRGVLAIVNDPAAASKCHAVGEGAHIDLSAGASPASSGGAFSLTGTVARLHDGKFATSGPVHGGTPRFDMGRAAVVQSEDGFTVLLTSNAVLPTTLAQLHAVGIDPRSSHVIIAKGVQSPMPAYGPIASRVVRVDTPGAAAPTLSGLSYKRRPRPLYPFETAGTFEGAENI